MPLYEISAKRGSTRQRSGARRHLLLSVMLPLAAVMCGSAFAQTLPSGGQVAAGQATIGASSGGNLVIDQSSSRAIINWGDFSVGAGHSVQFNNGSGATLNRVTGTSISAIDGAVGGTGSVYLINPNGVIIGRNGVVNVGGSFVASTLDASDADFNAGRNLTFSGPSTAATVNLGKIGALGGNVALIAATVKNAGSITAAQGSVGLIAGHSVLMRDTSVDGGNFLVLRGTADTSVDNTGAIEAATIELRAEGGNVYALAGNTNGLLKATGVSTRDGRIFLTAGDGGSVQVAGTTLVATDAKGGDIALRGTNISVASDSLLDVSAEHAGRITAIADLSNGSLDFHGTAKATGTNAGGFIETSGAQVNFTGARMDTSAANGLTGTWLVDPFDLTIDSAAASTISSNLGTTNITLQTTASGSSGPGVVNPAGVGDININAGINWASTNTLTLDAYHSINVNADIAVGGGGKVVLKTNNGGTGGDYGFNGNHNLSFDGDASSGHSLTINGAAYTLLYDMATFDSLDGTDQQAGTGVATSVTGNYALAKSLDAAGVIYSKGLVGTSSTLTFNGAFTGLGNTISNLTIAHASNSSLGLFGSTNATATIRDIGLLNASISVTAFTGNSYGMLIGNDQGSTVKNVYAIGTVTGATDVGGLIGRQIGTGSITNAFSMGSVTCGAAAGNCGGLVGRNQGGTITNTYSTASVTTVSATTTTNIGGLVGDNTGASNTSTINTSYATGAVTANNGSNVGGLAGRTGSSAANAAVVTNAFSTGVVTATGTSTNVGRLIGSRHSASTLTDNYYNSDTGAGNTSGVFGNVVSATGVTGLTTAQLQTALQTGYNTADWTTNGALGLYPFLNKFALTNTISGSARAADGSALTGAVVDLYIGTGKNAVSSGGDGSYAFSYLTPIGVSVSKLGATLTPAGGALSGATYSDSASGSITGFNLTSGTFVYTTARTAYSGLVGDLTSAFGADYGGVAALQPNGKLKVVATGGFTVDQAINQTGSVLIQANGGDLTIGTGGSISSAASGDAIILAANGAFKNNGTATSVAATNGRWLIYSQAFNDPTSLATGSLTGGLAGKSYYNDAYSFTTSGFASAPNAGNRFVYGYAPTLTVSADTKSVIYTGAAQTDTYSASGYLSVADQSADSLTGTVSGLTTSSKNVGTYTLTPSGTLVSDENYSIAYGSSGTLSITPASLVLTATSDTRTYDGTTTSSGTPVAVGLMSGDTVASLSQSFDAADAGARVLSVNSGYALNDGNGGANYNVSTATAAGLISALGITGLNWSVANGFSTYGTTAVLGQGTLSRGFVADQGLVLGTAGLFSGTTQINPTATTAAGTYAERVTGLTGSQASNYFLLATGNTEGVFVISPKLLSATLTGATSKVYNGNTVASLVAGNYSLSGVLAGDTVALNTVSTGAYADKNAGTGKIVSVSGLSLSGSSAGNYIVNTSASANIGTINKATLVASLVGTAVKTYDGTDAATLTLGNYVLTGALVGDSVAVANGNAGKYSDKNAGTAKVVNVSGLSLSGTDANNYAVNATASAAIGTINKRMIAAAADNLTKPFDAADPLLTYTWTLGSLVAGDSLTGSLFRDAGEAPGAYVIHQGTLAASTNYTFSFTPATLSIQSDVPQQDFITPIPVSDPVFMPLAFDYNAGVTNSGKPKSKKPAACDSAGAPACANLPYPTNKSVYSFIQFSGR